MLLWFKNKYCGVIITFLTINTEMLLSRADRDCTPESLSPAVSDLNECTTDLHSRVSNPGVGTQTQVFYPPTQPQDRQLTESQEKVLKSVLWNLEVWFVAITKRAKQQEEGHWPRVLTVLLPTFQQRLSVKFHLLINTITIQKLAHLWNATFSKEFSSSND